MDSFLVELQALKNFLFQPMHHFGPENNGSSELWICTNDFLKVLHTERV